jgi:serine/threonine protein kinase
MWIGPYRITSKLRRQGAPNLSKAVDSLSGTVVVVKRPNSPDNFENATEANILLGLSHPSIISLRDIVPTPAGPALILPYYGDGDLLDRFKRMGHCLTEAEAMAVASQILEVLVYLKGRRIVHRDIKPDNILVASPVFCIVVLADFGLAAVLPEEGTLEGWKGSPGYVAPEIWMGAEYTESVDVWSLGATLFASVAGRRLSEAQEPRKALEEIERAVRGLSEDPDLAHTSTDFRDLLKSMLAIDPSQRVSAEQALQHKWFHPTEEVYQPDLEGTF